LTLPYIHIKNSLYCLHDKYYTSNYISLSI